MPVQQNIRNRRAASRVRNMLAVLGLCAANASCLVNLTHAQEVAPQRLEARFVSSQSMIFESEPAAMEREEHKLARLVFANQDPTTIDDKIAELRPDEQQLGRNIQRTRAPSARLEVPNTELVGLKPSPLPKELIREESEQGVAISADRPELWAASRMCWRAAPVFSHPLYFEDIMLERHGHERYPCVQPLLAGTRFFTSISMLPYLMTVQCMGDEPYLLGHFRPGTCVYPYFQRPPFEAKALRNELIFATGVGLVP